MNFKSVITIFFTMIMLLTMPVVTYSENQQSLKQLRMKQDAEFLKLNQDYSERVLKNVPKRPDGTIDTTSRAYQKLERGYSQKRASIRNKYTQLDVSRKNEIQSILNDSNYKGRIENTGSMPANVNADVDLKANDLEAAKNLSKEWSNQKGGRAIEYYTIDDPKIPKTKPPKNWKDVVKVINPNTDTTLWTPETEAIKKAKIKDYDAWTTSGGLKATGNREMSRDARGHYLDNEKKFIHADQPFTGTVGGHNEDLKTFSKSVSKAAGPQGANITKNNPKFYEQADILRKYGDPVEAGIVNLGDSAEVQKQKIEDWKKIARKEMDKAKIESQKLGDAADTAREDLAEQMRKQGHDDIADRIEKHRHRVADSNRAAAEENNRLKKKNDELRNNKKSKSDSLVEAGPTKIEETSPGKTKVEKNKNVDVLDEIPPTQMTEPGSTTKGSTADDLKSKYRDLVENTVPRKPDGSVDTKSKEFNDLLDSYKDELRANRKKSISSTDINIDGNKKILSKNGDIDLPGKKKTGSVEGPKIDALEVTETVVQLFQSGTKVGGKAIDDNRDLNTSDLIDVVKDMTPGIRENEATKAALIKRRLDELQDTKEIRNLKDKKLALQNERRKAGDLDWRTATLDEDEEYLLAQAEKKKQELLEEILHRQKRNTRIKELESKFEETNDLTYDESMELAGLRAEQIKDGAKDVENMAVDKFQSYVDKMQKKRQKEGRDKDEFIRDGIPMFLEMMRDGFNLINPASQIGTPVAEGFSEMSTWDERQAFASSKDDWIKKVNLEAMKVDKNTRRYVDRLNQLLTSNNICDKNIQNQIEVLLNQLRNNSEKLYNLNKFADKILTGIDSGKLKRLRNLRRSMPDVKSLKQWEEQLIKEKCKPDDIITSSDDNTGNVIASPDDNAGYVISPPDKQESQKSDNTGPLQIIYRIEGNGYIPHYGGGSFQPSGHSDILITLEEPATEKNIQSILNKVSANYNIDICSAGISAYPSGNRPPSIWKTCTVTIIRGPASDLSNVKLENTWKSKGDGPSLGELKKGIGCKK